MEQEKKNVFNKQNDQAQKDAERREYEKKQMEARRAEEELRRREMEELESLRKKEQETVLRQQTEMKSLQNVDLTYRSPADQKPGDLTGFGFGNVRTGQVSTRKITFLTRSSSEERGDLNPEVSTPDGIQSRSARASPLPQMSLQKFQEPTQTGIDDVKGPKSVQWSQQSAAIAKTDFASSTKALGSGLVRSSKSAASSSMATSMKSESQSMSKSSFIQESAASFATQSKMEFSSSSSKSSASSFQVSKTTK